MAKTFFKDADLEDKSRQSFNNLPSVINYKNNTDTYTKLGIFISGVEWIMNGWSVGGSRDTWKRCYGKKM